MRGVLNSIVKTFSPSARSQSDITIPATPLPFTTIYAKGHPLLFTPDGWKSRFAYDHLMLLDKDSVDWTKIKAEAMKK